MIACYFTTSLNCVFDIDLNGRPVVVKTSLCGYLTTCSFDTFWHEEIISYRHMMTQKREDKSGAPPALWLNAAPSTLSVTLIPTRLPQYLIQSLSEVYRLEKSSEGDRALTLSHKMLGFNGLFSNTVWRHKWKSRYSTSEYTILSVCFRKAHMNLWISAAELIAK